MTGGPFFHGTRGEFRAGDELVPGHGSNFQAGRVSNNVYFTALVSTAAWGAQLATALAGVPGPGRIYVVEPLGAYEDDPNVTDKKFPGNPTRSFRSREPLRVARELTGWVGHSPEKLEAMRASLAALQREGKAQIED